MNWLRSLFDVRGRTTRLGYWRRSLEIVALGCLAWLIGLLAMIKVGPSAAILLAPIPVLLAAVVPLAVRRLHDRGKSAWWLVVFYGIPIGIAAATESWKPKTTGPALLFLALSLVSLGITAWAWVEIGFRRGTQGPNRFGDEPAFGR